MDFGNVIMFIRRRFSFISTMIFQEDRKIVSASQTRSIKPSRDCRDSLSVPTDLIIDIFSRLPAKSAARCRCLSKFWDNLICSQYFIDLFAVKSSARPQILFVLGKNSKLSFFSADQPSKISSDNIAFTHLSHGPKIRCNYQQTRYNYQRVGVPINGLVCISEYSEYYGGGGMKTTVIYNSSTGEFLTLPKMKTTQWRYSSITSFLGYDPTEKLFKVLSVYHDSLWLKERCDQHQILTLETKQLSWRSIVCKPHAPIRGSEICINGVLYYLATGISHKELIVCFDVRSETFRFIKVMETFNKNISWTSILTNYDGKLSLLIPEEPITFVTGESRSFELWVLKDEWSKHVYVLPPIWKDIVGKNPFIMFVGMIGTNEIVLSALYCRYYLFGVGDVLPYLFYYNTEKNTIRKLNIQRTGASTFEQVYIFLNQVENVKLLN